MLGNIKATDEEKMNNRYKSLLNSSLDSAKTSGSDFKDNPHNSPASGGGYTGPMKSKLMTWTSLLENMDEIAASAAELSADVSPMDTELPADPSDGGDNMEKDILDELNQIFTPVLVMQDFEGEIADKIQEAYAEASVLTERNILKFDDETRMAQLISVCAKLLQKHKNTPAYQTYEKAARLRNQMALQMQNEEYEAAKALAQKYLVKVSTSNNSSVARDAANKLLPETQH